MRVGEFVRTGPGRAAALAVAATALVAAVDPGVPGRYPTCPFLAVTGHLCPFCGSLRSVHALTRLDLATSLHCNLLTIPLVALAVGFWAVWAARTCRGQPPRRILPVWAVWAIVAVAAMYAVLRNLPGFEALTPPV